MLKGSSKDYLRGSQRGHGTYHSLPIEEFLKSRIGKHWDKIYSELSQEYDKRTEAGRRFFKNLDYHVEKNCWKGAETGQIYDSKNQLVSGFYVHPFSKCLEYQKYDKWKQPKRDQEPIDFIAIKEGEAYQKIHGNWYHTKITKNPYFVPYWMYHNKDADKFEKQMFGESYHIIEKRQLNTKELKQLGFKNDIIEEKK